jgi:hypothetical protein
MKYFKMVIRLGLFVAVSPFWIFFLVFFAVMDTILVFINWFNNDVEEPPYYSTRYVFVMYKWVTGG